MKKKIKNEKKNRAISHPYPDNQTVIKTIRGNKKQSDNITLNKRTWKCSPLARFAKLTVFVFFPLKNKTNKPEEGEDDVKSSCPLCLGRHTCYNGRDKGS